MKKLLKGEQTDLIKCIEKNYKVFDPNIEWQVNKINFVLLH
ncbi:hypothetical protein [Bacillus thuringiensis]|nr:hypothetical protein [Bacillus thuringiensis]EEM86081.1 DNA topoisomerase III [Bacillus thuringiensis serovar pulsiensis BGSC 4CC1]